MIKSGVSGRRRWNDAISNWHTNWPLHDEVENKKGYGAVSNIGSFWYGKKIILNKKIF